MNIQPLNNYRPPALPSRPELEADPRPLLRRLPGLWRRAALTPGMVALLIGAGARLTAAEEPAATPAAAAVAADADDPAVRLLIAPLFEHGVGRGTIGCIAVNPPTFLSEEEALTVIREELARSGLGVDGDPAVWAEVRVSERMVSYVEDDEGGWSTEIEPTGATNPLRPDLLVDDGGLAVVYVGARPSERYRRLGGPTESSTAPFYDTKGTARRLLAQVRTAAQRELAFAAVYDPLIASRQAQEAAGDELDGLKGQARWEAIDAKAAELGRDELRRQVRDLVLWYRTGEAGAAAGHDRQPAADDGEEVPADEGAEAPADAGADAGSGS